MREYINPVDNGNSKIPATNATTLLRKQDAPLSSHAHLLGLDLCPDGISLSRPDYRRDAPTPVEVRRAARRLIDAQCAEFFYAPGRGRPRLLRLTEKGRIAFLGERA
jgi:hypothetical protein